MRRQGPARGRLPEGGPQRAHAAQARARSARPSGTTHRRGLPVPGHLHAASTARRRATWSTASSPRSSENLAKVDLAYAKRKNLTRYDVLIIASMVEREAQLDRERPLVAAVIYNRLKEGMTLGIDATIRYYENNWTRAAARVRARARQPVQHAPEPRPAADADRQPRPGLDQGGRQPRARQGLPVLRAQAGRQSASTRSRPPTRSSSATWRSTRPRASPDRRAPARRLRLAGRPLALAGDAQRRAGGGWPGGLALPAAAAAAGAVRRDGARAARGRLPRRQRDDPAQGGGARARRRRRRDAARAIGAANTLTFERDGAIDADNTDAPGLLAALGERLGPGRPARARARRRRAPRAPPCGRSLRAGAADVAVWNRTPERAARAGRRSSARGPSSSPGRPRSSSTARPSGWRIRTMPRSRRYPCRPIAWVPEAAWWTWSTGTAGRDSSKRQEREEPT